MSTRLVRAGLSACILLLIALAVLAPALSASSAAGAPAQTLEPGYYDIGNPTLHDIWVDPFRGADSDSGDSRSHALRTLSEA